MSNVKTRPLAGVELGGVSGYLSEIATPGHKGFYVSWQSASQQVAVMFSALVGVVLSFALPPGSMEHWDSSRCADE
jgi:MFS family permease